MTGRAVPGPQWNLLLAKRERENDVFRRARTDLRAGLVSLGFRSAWAEAAGVGGSARHAQMVRVVFAPAGDDVDVTGGRGGRAAWPACGGSRNEAAARAAARTRRD